LISSLISCCGDPLFDKYKGNLVREATQAHRDFCDRAGVSEITDDHALAMTLPCKKPKKLVSTSFTSRVCKTVSSKYGIMGLLSSFLQLYRRSQLRARALGENTSDRAKSDAIHLWTITSKSQLNRIVAADIAQPANRMEARYCLEILAFYTGIPAHLSGGVSHADFDYKVTRCGACSGPGGDQFFDANGDHTAACSNTHATRSYTHRALAGTVQQFATEAGFKVTREPSTELILSSLGEAGRLRNLLPTKTGKVSQAAQREVEAKLNGIRSTSDPALRQAMAREAVGSLPIQAEDQPSLRGDLLIEDPAGRRPSKLLDLTAPHDSCKTFRRGQYPTSSVHTRRRRDCLKPGSSGPSPGRPSLVRRHPKRSTPSTTSLKFWPTSRPRLSASIDR
jgi:hypothetical protein